MARTYNDEMFIDTFEHQYTWLNGFLRNVRRYGSRQAMLDPQTGRAWDYRALNAEANRLAHALRGAGVGKDDVVMTTLMNTPEFAFTYIGPRKIGAILNPANFSLSSGELALLMDHNRPKVYIYSADMRETAAKAVAAAQYPPAVVVMADNLSGAAVPEGHISYEDFVAGQPQTDPTMDFRPHIYDEVLRLCTSGTTALPKSAALNDINEVLSAHDVIMHYPLNCNDVCMNMTPWFHRGGCHCGGPGPSFYVGASVVVCRSFIPRQCLQWVEKYGITFLMGAPSSLEMLARTQERHPVNLSQLRGLVTMGAPFEKAACERYLKVLTPNIFNGYGTTETFWNSFLRPYDLPEFAGTVGGSCIDDEVRVVRVYEDHKAEPDDLVPTDNETVGEIIIWSPAKSTYSYYQNPAEEEKKFYKGWMYTGDLGYWCENLYITVNGRKDDMIVCSAENVYPSQVEEVLNGCDKVADCMVTGVPDRVRGQAVVAYVVKSDPSLTVEELVAYCQGSAMLSAYKCPRWYRFVDELPHTATGKKMHYVLKWQAEQDMAAGLLIRGTV
ncbi:MAG: AMP-binding protein [Oscillospiraceae bacterium]|nr:AMP-binding protein [Oscillospiraceae bacterium]